MQFLIPVFVPFAVAFVAVLLLTPLMRRLAFASGIVDRPDHRRKLHRQPIAYLGGVAIFLGWLAGVTAAEYLPLRGMAGAFPPFLIAGAGLVVLAGLFDDAYGLSPRLKVGTQLMAAACLTQHQIGLDLAGCMLQLVGLDAPPALVYALGTLAVAAVVVGACNAVNLLDGLDGLAAGTTLISVTGFLAIALLVAAGVYQAAPQPGAEAWNGLRITLCIATAGALLGFLPYNFNPARIFMGDSGSLLLGYLAAAIILLFSNAGGASMLLVTACLIVFALPITDTSLAIVRRKLRGQPLFSPDNGHIHHLLRRSGLGVRASVLVMYAIAGLFAALGVAMVAMEWRWRWILLAAAVLYGMLMVGFYLYGQAVRRAERPEPPPEPSPHAPDAVPPRAVALES